MKKHLCMLSAAVVIGALRANYSRYPKHCKMLLFFAETDTAEDSSPTKDSSKKKNHMKGKQQGENTISEKKNKKNKQHMKGKQQGENTNPEKKNKKNKQSPVPDTDKGQGHSKSSDKLGQGQQQPASMENKLEHQKEALQHNKHKQKHDKHGQKHNKREQSEFKQNKSKLNNNPDSQTFKPGKFKKFKKGKNKE